MNYAARATKATSVLIALTCIACVPSCSRRGAERVLVQFADELYGDRRAVGVGTGAYPRVEIAGETRIFCSQPERDTLEGTLLSHDVTLPRGTDLHFAFALDAGESFAGIVDVNAAVTMASGTKIIFRRTLDGAANDFGRWHDAVAHVPEDATHVDFFAAATGTSIPGSGLADERVPSLHLACPVATVAATEAPRRNVVLVSLDTLRADRLGLYGYGRDTSPRMDRIFGERGFVFERAIAPASNTLRSHAGMLTGLQPILAVEGWRDPSLARLGYHPTLADWLRASGYRTAAFTENGFVSDVTFRFGQGFEIFHARKGVAGNVHNAGTIGETFRRGVQWVEAHATEPFFLFLHSYEVHSPYRPVRELRERFPSPPAADAPRIDSDLYDAEVAQADRAVGDLVDALQRLGVLERTILIVTSDHGEEFGEHGGRYHGAHLYGEILDVPLLVLAPGLAPKGRRIADVVSLIDVTPTVLDLVGIAPPDYMTGRSRAAEILTGAAAAPEPGMEPATVLFSEGVAAESMTYSGLDPEWRSPSLAATAWPRRLIRYAREDGARYELYDLDDDPAEKKNVYEENASRSEIVALREALDDYEATWSEKARALGRAAEPGAAPAEPAPKPSGRQLEELRALGYVD